LGFGVDVSLAINQPRHILILKSVKLIIFNHCHLAYGGYSLTIKICRYTQKHLHNKNIVVEAMRYALKINKQANTTLSSKIVVACVVFFG